jgi:uncharacterized protein (DUF1499 family)
MAGFPPRLRNWAETDEPNDPPLASVVLPLVLAAAVARVEEAIRSLPRWQVVHSDAQAGTVIAIRRTRLFRFTDDITVRLEPAEGMTRVGARSQSRVGLTDFGQNRRNLLELLDTLRARSG